jgi:hypothetical protein
MTRKGKQLNSYNHNHETNKVDANGDENISTIKELNYIPSYETEDKNNYYYDVLFDEFTSSPSFYHIKVLGQTWLKETILNGERKLQHMVIFKDELKLNQRHCILGYDPITDEGRLQLEFLLDFFGKSGSENFYWRLLN